MYDIMVKMINRGTKTRDFLVERVETFYAYGTINKAEYVGLMELINVKYPVEPEEPATESTEA